MKNFIIVSIATIMVFSLWTVTYAVEDYTVLAPLPGIGDPATGKTDLQKYLPAAFKLGIGIAAALAFVMITLGGITYATSDAVFQKSQGKEWITNAIWGLLLVIGAWVILNTINPKILSFNLSLPKPNIAPSTAPATAGVPMTEEEKRADTAVRNRLTALNIGVNAGPCTQGQTSGCTNVNGLQESVIVGLQRLKNACKCLVKITGGTEGGHTTGSVHNSGIAVDIDPVDYIKNELKRQNRLVACQIHSAFGGNFMWEPRGSTCGGNVPSTNDHFHAVF